MLWFFVGVREQNGLACRHTLALNADEAKALAIERGGKEASNKAFHGSMKVTMTRCEAVLRVPSERLINVRATKYGSSGAAAHAKVLLYPNGSQRWAFTPLRGVFQAVYL